MKKHQIPIQQHPTGPILLTQGHQKQGKVRETVVFNKRRLRK
jgi:hypothetical protein